MKLSQKKTLPNRVDFSFLGDAYNNFIAIQQHNKVENIHVSIYKLFILYFISSLKTNKWKSINRIGKALNLIVFIERLKKSINNLISYSTNQ